MGRSRVFKLTTVGLWDVSNIIDETRNTSIVGKRPRATPRRLNSLDFVLVRRVNYGLGTSGGLKRGGRRQTVGVVGFGGSAGVGRVRTGGSRARGEEGWWRSAESCGADRGGGVLLCLATG